MDASEKYETMEAMANEIEQELEMVQGGNRNAGALTVKVQSFCNMLRREDQNDPRVRQLGMKGRYFTNQMRSIAEREAQERESLEAEMISSNIKSRGSSYEQEGAGHGDEFYKENTGRIDSFICSTMNSIHSLRRQGAIIERANYNLRGLLTRAGLSSEMLQRIEQRFGRDKALFYFLCGLLGFVLFLLFFFFLAL